MESSRREAGRRAGGMRVQLLVRTAAAALVAGSASMALPSSAYAQSAEINIEAGNLGDALMQLARQANVDISAPANVTKGKRSPAVKGSMSVETALDRLLADSGLSVRRIRDRSFVVEPPQGNALAGGPNAGTDNPTSSSGEDAASEGVSEILVIGSRSQNADIRRSENDAQPYVVFDHKAIEASQAATVEDFLRTRLPMSSSKEFSLQAKTNQTVASPYFNSTGQISLRGLSADQTLILVDGRRRPGVTIAGNIDPQQPDLNGIPVSAIDRIEILPATAGGIYGGNAVGGVINIILKHDYRGLDFQVGHDGRFGAGADTVKLALSGGFKLEGGRTSVSFALSQTDENPLYAGQTDVWRKGRARFLRNDPNQSLISGYTTNIQSISDFDFDCLCFLSPDLVLDDGTPLNSPRTYVPVGYQGVTTDGGAALIQNAGELNPDLATDASGSNYTLRRGTRVRAASLSVRRTFSDHVEAFIDASHSENRSRSRFPEASAQFTLTADSPNNPFRQDISVYVPFPGHDISVTSTAKSSSVVGGIIFRLPQNWSASLEAGWSKASYYSKYSNGFLNSIVGDAIQSGQLDVLRDVNRYPLDLDGFTLARDQQASFIGPSDNVLKTGSARLSGPLFALPGGSAKITALVEARDERLESINALDQTRFGDNFIYYPERGRKVRTAYAELTMPLLSEDAHLPAVRSLDLTVSIRHDRFETNTNTPNIVQSPVALDQLPSFVENTARDHSTDFTVAGRWEPIRGLRLRGSYGTGYLPPSLNQLTAGIPTPRFFSIYVDPRRGNERLGSRGNFRDQCCGDPNLSPEKSQSLSFGAILEPRALKGLRISVDYSRIKKSDEIRILGQEILAFEEDFPDRVVRGPNLPGDPVGWPGPITLFKYGYTNIGSTKSEAIDLRSDYELSLSSDSTLHLYALATVQRELSIQLTSSADPYDTVGFADGPLKWRGNGGIDYARGPWRIFWNLQYFGSYRIRYGNPQLAFTSGYLEALNGRAKIPSQIYNDLLVTCDLSRLFKFESRHIQLSAGITNLFNKHPPAIADPVAGWSPYGDPRLRRYSLGLKASF